MSAPIDPFPDRDGRPPAEDATAEVEDFDKELQRTRSNVELMALLDARSKPRRTHSLAEARALLAEDDQANQTP